MTKTNMFEYRYLDRDICLLPANTMSFEELFDHYVRAGFMYQEKLDRIKPNLNLIKENWEKAWMGGNSILWTAIYKDLKLEKTGTLTAWKTADDTWVFQHLTSEHSRAVFSLIATALNEGILMNYKAGQNWFSPTNEFSINLYDNESIFSQGDSQTILFHYYKINTDYLKLKSNEYIIKEAKEEDFFQISDFLERKRGSLFCESENIYSNDLNLEKLNSEFRKLGLERKKYHWIAYSEKDMKIKAVLSAHRGPYGFNFSFLENRCEIVMDNSVGKSKQSLLCSMLLEKASSVYLNKNIYIDYPENNLYVLVDKDLSEAMDKIGAVKIRDYIKGIFLKKGFYQWRDYLMRIFNKKKVPQV